ncbi:hypothetical protein [Staphylococcus saprophyticus]|nr:hypothetical protein [Staphylococcus saprophyticus]
MFIVNGSSNTIIERQTNYYTFIHFSMQQRVNVRVGLFDSYEQFLRAM